MDIPSYILGKKAGGGGGSNYQSKSVEITENGTTSVTPDTGYDALSNVNVTVSGILDTSDATATASDMATGTTAYVNGSKITGDVPIGSSSVATNYASNNVGTYIDDLRVDTEQGIRNQMFRTGDKISVYAPLTDVAPVIGATAEKIKKNEVICGVTGTYEGSGPTEPEEKDVNFYDYDGTRVYSYTKDEFLALESLPANPTHEGLTAQGWNWTYQQMRDYVTDIGICDVGQMYTTSDGYTRIYVDMFDKYYKTPRIQIKVSGTVNINFGDNTSDVVLTGSSYATKSTTHTYQNTGSYIITIKPQGNSTFKFFGNQTYRESDFISASSDYSHTNATKYKYYGSMIKKIELGNNVQLDVCGITNFNNMEYITLPNTLDNFYYNIMYCSKLKNVVVPNSLTKINDSNRTYGSFIQLVSCERVILPNTIDDYKSISFDNDVSKNRIIPSSVIYNPWNCIGKTTPKVIMPASITSGGISYRDYISEVIYKGDIQTISDLAYQSIFYYVDFSNCTSVPPITGSVTTNGGSFNYVVVPDNLYESWIVADKWSTVANKIIKKSDWEAQQ